MLMGFLYMFLIEFTIFYGLVQCLVDLASPFLYRRVTSTFLLVSLLIYFPINLYFYQALQIYLSPTFSSTTKRSLQPHNDK